uniref:(northern house mosquito) hypothetical protein n=1 Tax=Culex pipiens TaxID=7175 RepID=A0A8D8B1T0_CULPI
MTKSTSGAWALGSTAIWQETHTHPRYSGQGPELGRNGGSERLNQVNPRDVTGTSSSTTIGERSPRVTGHVNGTSQSNQRGVNGMPPSNPSSTRTRSRCTQGELQFPWCKVNGSCRERTTGQRRTSPHAKCGHR